MRVLVRPLLALVFLIGHAASSSAQSYLVYSSQPLCESRAQTRCQALACDGTFTIHWWGCIGPFTARQAGSQTVPANAYALLIEPSRAFGVGTSTTKSNGAQGLSASEQSNLVTAAQIAPLLPVTTQTGQSVGSVSP